MYKAMIFDMDGVITDTMSWHCQAYRDALKGKGVFISEEEFFMHAGKSGKQLLEDIMKIKNASFDVEKVYHRKNQLYRKLLKNVKPFPNMVKLISILGQKYKLALVSGSSIRNVNIILNKLNLKHKFDVIIGGDEVKRGKPYPDIFLKAAGELGVLPKECVVFEDTEFGIEGAKSAGMEYIKIEKGNI